jgi:hypothetical protein
MSQAAHRIDVGALAHLGESHTVVNALVPPVVTTGAEAARTRNWLSDTASFETMAYALTQQSPNVPYLYMGTEDGSFFGLEREATASSCAPSAPGDSGRRHYQIEQPGDRSQLVRTETTIYDPRKRPWYQLAVSTGRAPSPMCTGRRSRTSSTSRWRTRSWPRTARPCWACWPST